jgi:hypothetical protein
LYKKIEKNPRPVCKIIIMSWLQINEEEEELTDGRGVEGACREPNHTTARKLGPVYMYIIQSSLLQPHLIHRLNRFLAARHIKKIPQFFVFTLRNRFFCIFKGQVT